jgi:hypothetical protein
LGRLKIKLGGAVDSPRLRYAGRPSLPQAAKRVSFIFGFYFIISSL